MTQIVSLFPWYGAPTDVDAAGSAYIDPATFKQTTTIYLTNFKFGTANEGVS